MKKTTYIKIGFIVAATIFLLYWGLNYLKNDGIFNDDKVYFVVYDRIDGLAVSNPVLINGFAVGQVRHISFLPDNSGRLLVTLAVGSEYGIPLNSVARIYSSDLMGTKAIGIDFTKTATMHQSGDTLIPDFEGSLQELVSVQMLPLKNKAESLMKQMEDAIEMVNYIFNENTQNDILESFKNIKSTFAHLENSSSNLDSIVYRGKGSMENILANIESITNNLEKNNNYISKILANMSSISDSMAQSNLKQLINQTEQTIAQLNEIATKINNNEGSLGLLINDSVLYTNLADVSYNINRLTEDLRMNPKRYVHFSAISMGKTVISQEETDYVETKKVVYKILIQESNKSIPLNPQNFKGYKNVQEGMYNGIYIYMLGQKRNIEGARSLLKDVQVDFPEAKILEIKDGSYAIMK